MDDLQAEVEIMIAGTYLYFLLLFCFSIPHIRFDQNHPFAEKD